MLKRMHAFIMMKGQQHLTPEALQNLQLTKLKRLIQTAWNQVPFYQRHFEKAGIRPADIRDLSDLKNIPIVNRHEVQRAGLNQMLGGNIKKNRCIYMTTSGSSGKPLELYFKRSDFTKLNVNWMRPLLAYGVKPWNRRMEITGPHNIQKRKRSYQNLGLFRNQSISIFKAPSDWADFMRLVRPGILYGYSGSLKLFARHLLNSGNDYHKPKFVIGVSDQVDPDGRRWVREAFGKDLIDLYGAAETGCIAWECPVCHAYHINADTVIVEIIKDGRTAEPGEIGRVVVTNLHSHSMPFIRYDLGDIGSLSRKKSRCGIRLPLMSEISGRSDAFIVLPSGRMLSPMFFFALMKPFREIMQWRVIQLSPGEISVKIVSGPGYHDDIKARIRNHVLSEFAEPCRIHIDVVPVIDNDATGKIRSVISHVKNPLQGGI